MHYDDLINEEREKAELENRKREATILLKNLDKLTASELRTINLLIASRSQIKAFLKSMKTVSKILEEK
jgi:hypothetical protein